MKEIIKLIVVNKGIEEDLEIIHDANVIEFVLNGKSLCMTDWDGNFKQAVERMLEIWK